MRSICCAAAGFRDRATTSRQVLQSLDFPETKNPGSKVVHRGGLGIFWMDASGKSLMILYVQCDRRLSPDGS